MSRMPTIIKAGSALPAARSTPHSMELTDVLMEARSVLQRARREADRIRAEARQESVAAHQAAKAEGMRAGYEEGLEAGREAGSREAFEAAMKVFEERHAEVVEACRTCIGQINEGRASWERSAREDLVELAMAIGRRVAHHVGDRERQVVLANIEEAVRLAGARSEVTIAVNPQDAGTARTFAHEIADGDGAWTHIRVIEEPEVSPGGCRVQWDSGAVDATLETQLERIEQELRAAGAMHGTDDAAS